MINLLVTGSNGQLGRCLKQQLHNAGDISCYFASKEDLDITDNEAVQGFFLVNTTLIIVLIQRPIPM
jgi:dTDP-4-dehydrorhamnose reductase